MNTQIAIDRGSRTFALAPLKPLVWWGMGAVALVAFGFGVFSSGDGTLYLALPSLFMVALVSTPIVLALQRRRISVEGRTLLVAAGPWTRRIGIDRLALESARIVDLEEHTELKPMLGLMRVGLPGFRAGHYLLRNGRRAFCLLTSYERVLVLPTHEGAWLLLSPEQPQTLLGHLRVLAGDSHTD